MSGQMEFLFTHQLLGSRPPTVRSPTPIQRTFFVVLFQDVTVRTCLNALRLFANPATRQEAHITTRGPYKNREAIDADQKWRKKATEAQIHVFDIGAFFSGSQNTVFFRAEIINYDPDMFWKPHFKNSISHITVYDGSSRKFAESIKENLAAWKWNFMTVGTKPREMVSQSKKQGDFYIYLSVDYSILDDTLGFRVDPRIVMRMSPFSRLLAINRVIRYLADYVATISPPAVSL